MLKKKFKSRNHKSSVKVKKKSKILINKNLCPTLWIADKFRESNNHFCFGCKNKLSKSSSWMKIINNKRKLFCLCCLLEDIKDEI